MAEAIRIKPDDHETLRSLSAETGRTMSDLLTDAVLDLKRRFVLEATANGYRALQQDAQAWQAELAERQDWDTAVVSDAHMDDWK